MEHTHTLIPERWYQLHSSSLYAFALRRSGDTELAADLVQETLLAAWRARHRFSGRATERTWLTAILRHKIADHFRRQEHARQCGVEDGGGRARNDEDAGGAWEDRVPAPGGVDPEAGLLVDEKLKFVMERIDSLPKTMSRALVMRAIEERDPEHICAELDVTRGHLGVILHRARARLRPPDRSESDVLEKGQVHSLVAADGQQ